VRGVRIIYKCVSEGYECGLYAVQCEIWVLCGSCAVWLCSCVCVVLFVFVGFVSDVLCVLCILCVCCAMWVCV
jgi:hypothetical protein